MIILTNFVFSKEKPCQIENQHFFAERNRVRQNSVLQENRVKGGVPVPTQQGVHPNIVISSVFLGEFITCILIYLLHTCTYSMKHFFTARCLTFLRTTLTKRRSPLSTVRFLGPAKNRTMRDSYQLSSTYTEFNQFCRLPYL